MPEARSARLVVHLLGSLRVAVNEIPVEVRTQSRSWLLFAYLVTHRDPPPPPEVLMELFWPRSEPNAARNSLNVAIHGLRRELRAVTDVPVIVRTGGGYRLHTGLWLWVDIEEFDRRLRQARRFEVHRDRAAALATYEHASLLYRGDFLTDVPYEEWTTVVRERLRLAHLEALVRLGDFHFELEHYSACAMLCQQVIDRDPCREDVRRQLMRCQSRLGLTHLALLQYRECVRVLAKQLGVRPSPATVELNERLRWHHPV